MFKVEEGDISHNGCKERSKTEVKSETADNENSNYNPLFYCRTCANKDTFFVPIFKEQGLNHQLNKKIEKYLPIQVTKDDDLPVQLCYNCASTIIAWDTLLIGCLEAERKLKRLKEESIKSEYLDRGIEREEKTEMTNGSWSDNVDSDDEPLITKKLCVLKNSGKRITKQKDITEEKSNGGRSCQKLEVKSNKIIKSVPRQVRKNINAEDQNLVKYESREYGSDHGGTNIECERISEKKSNFLCPICFKTFFGTISFCQDLYSHLKKNSNVFIDGDTEKYNCKICNYPVAKIYELPQHLLSHIDPKMIKISEGQSVIGRRKRRKKHGILDPTMRSTCEICGKTISRKYTMKRHLITHSGEKRFTCHHCGKQYAQESGLQRHVSVIHEGIRKYKCPICSKIFGSNFELKNHQYTHEDPRPFQCDQCGRTFICQKHLYHHWKYHHTVNGLRQLCKICNKYFSSPGVLKRHHKVIHLGLKEFQCHICSTQLSTKQYLQEHLKIHSDERPEVCSICGKTFQMAGNLRQHIKIHMEKTQICDICGKGFTRRCHLITHMGCHKGSEKPQCKYCEKRFLLKADLEKHIKNDHAFQVLTKCKEK